MVNQASGAETGAAPKDGRRLGGQGEEPLAGPSGALGGKEDNQSRVLLST